MRVNLSTLGKFHTFDLARELLIRGMLGQIYTGYPIFKLRDEGIPIESIKSFPYFHAPYMAFKYKDLLPLEVLRLWEYWSRTSLDYYSAQNISECDVFVGLSSSALCTGRVVKARGGKYVCDRGSTHIGFQEEILREEHDIWGQKFDGIDPKIVDREMQEYEESDIITVPSGFTYRSFLQRGVALEKIRKIPYGVNLSRFNQVDRPNPDSFDILFVGGMSLRKGVQYLVEAYKKITHPNKSLTFAGVPSESLIDMLKQKGLWVEEARVLGHVPQSELKKLFSRSHVLVLPSIEEGLAMVQAQAMACACVVVASENTGAEDLFENGIEGYIVPARSADQIAEKLQFLADNPEVRDEMAEKAMHCVKELGGWSNYGNVAVSTYQELINEIR